MELEAVVYTMNEKYPKEPPGQWRCEMFGQYVLPSYNSFLNRWREKNAYGSQTLTFWFELRV